MKFDSLDSSFVCTRFHQVPSNRILTKLTLRFHSCSLSVHCEFSRIVCVSLFSYQGSLFVCLSDNSFTLSHSSVPVKCFFQVFSRHFLMSVCRPQATCLLYHMFVSLSTTFSLFSKLFKLFIQKKQFLATAQLEYHFLTGLSTLFLILISFRYVQHNIDILQ